MCKKFLEIFKGRSGREAGGEGALGDGLVEGAAERDGLRQNYRYKLASSNTSILLS